MRGVVHPVAILLLLSACGPRRERPHEHGFHVPDPVVVTTEAGLACSVPTTTSSVTVTIGNADHEVPWRSGLTIANAIDHIDPQTVVSPHTTLSRACGVQLFGAAGWSFTGGVHAFLAIQTLPNDRISVR
jgi:hypothetical protein